MKVLAILTVLSAVAMSSVGCSLSPAQIESDTAMGTSLLLSGAVALDPAEKAHITGDTLTTILAIRDQVIPAFSSTATGGSVAAGAITQAMTLLKTKLASSPTGAKVSEVVALLQAPLVAALGSTASPTSLLSPTAQLQWVAFWSGIQLGGSQFLQRPDLAPAPLPAPAPIPAPTPAPPPPAPIPSPPK
jgi:hypothetical protein